MFHQPRRPRRLHALGGRAPLRRLRDRHRRRRPADRQRRADRPAHPDGPSTRCWCGRCRCSSRSAPTEFALRRLGRITQAAWCSRGRATYVDWTPAGCWSPCCDGRQRAVIFFALFVGFSCVQFWTPDATEFANAFTYGGNTLTQYPLTHLPAEVVRALTFVVPVAFVNWYPCLYILDRADPFGLPDGSVRLAGRGAAHHRRRRPRLAHRRPPLPSTGKLSMTWH